MTRNSILKLHKNMEGAITYKTWPSHPSSESCLAFSLSPSANALLAALNFSCLSLARRETWGGGWIIEMNEYKSEAKFVIKKSYYWAIKSKRNLGWQIKSTPIRSIRKKWSIWADSTQSCPPQPGSSRRARCGPPHCWKPGLSNGMLDVMLGKTAWICIQCRANQIIALKWVKEGGGQTFCTTLRIISSPMSHISSAEKWTVGQV